MGRVRGCLWLTAGLIVAVLAGFVAFVTLSRAAAQSSGQRAGPTVPVVVAARTVAVRSVLTAEDVEQKELPVEAVPEGAVRDIDQAVGRITLVDLYPGEILLDQRLMDPNVIAANGRMALVMAEDEVLLALPAEDLISRVGVLKPGDRVDLLFSVQVPTNRGPTLVSGGGEMPGSGGVVMVTSKEKEQVTLNLLQNVTIAAIVPGRTPTGGTDTRTPSAILLTVSPQDALVLKYVKDLGGVLDIVLRAPGAERPFSTEPVDVDYLIHRYQIPTEVGR
ncbi:MAG TPA: Flp pilus assembly protein CpaB [Caldilineae bacterium]|nr:Flp pilus assembly protein CpaB [Caldilineae bacterium]